MAGLGGIKHYAQRPSSLVKEVWTSGLYSRLPSFYRKNLEEWEKYKSEAQTPHENPKQRWYLDEFGAPRLTNNVPIRVHFPEQCDKGLWGGEGIIEGLIVKKKRWYDVYIPKMWRPGLSRRVFYSEILNKYLIITCTQRTLNLVDEANGFDYYILKTHPVELRSQLALDLRRQMLLRLARKQTKSSEIYKKYKKFSIPEKEAEWFGLRLDEAVAKQAQIEERERDSSIKPLKNIFRQQLLIRLKEGSDLSQRSEDDEETESADRSTFSKLAFWRK